jgi:hypothetical protein
MSMVNDYGHITCAESSNNGALATGSTAVPPFYAWTFT